MMVIPANRAPRDLQALLDGKVDSSVRDDDISALAERRNDRRDGRKCLRVGDGRLGTKEIRNVLFKLNMDV